MEMPWTKWKRLRQEKEDAAFDEKTAEAQKRAQENRAALDKAFAEMDNQTKQLVFKQAYEYGWGKSGILNAPPWVWQEIISQTRRAMDAAPSPSHTIH